MLKILNIGYKDLLVTFRDRAALILMLAAPFALTLGIAFVSGRFSDSGAGGTGLEQIPIVLVNGDGGALSAALVEIFTSDELSDLIAPGDSDSPAAARTAVDDDAAAAAVIIPIGFTAAMQSGDADLAAPIELYANPARPVSAGVVRAILESFLNRVDLGLVAGQVTVEQLIGAGLLAPAEAATVGQTVGRQLAETDEGLVTIQNEAALRRSEGAQDASAAGDGPSFDLLAFIAPGMALLFLMYTVSLGGRSILAERNEGTLTRMLATPTTTAQVLGGKMLGIYLTGLAQVGILILSTALLFQVSWGNPLNVALLVMVVVAAATGWGLLLAALARTPGQVAQYGSAMMLTFGVLGGSFIPASQFPGWLRAVSAVTPNRWGLDGFIELALGGSLLDIWQPLAALLLMAAVLFIAAVLVFRRQFE